MSASIAKQPVVVAGHICLDIIPRFIEGKPELSKLLIPGGLVEMGAAVLSTGGVVSNTGLALHSLGVPVRLVGKVGDDRFGDTVLALLEEHGSSTAEYMLVLPGETTSYSVVINPPGIDRIFLHCPGANDTFAPTDIPSASLDGAGWFHFGYPPLMKKMYEDGGVGLEELLRNVKSRGLGVSLDMTAPDPNTPSGRAGWRTILEKILSLIDIFIPSLDEITYMLEPELFEQIQDSDEVPGLDEIRKLTAGMLGMGAAIAGVKLGEHGLYVRGNPDRKRLSAVPGMNSKRVETWAGGEWYAPAFQVETVGTTGAGDCAAAGFLAGFLRGLPPADVLRAAVGAGGCCVEKPDAVSGVPEWNVLWKRLKSSWKTLPALFNPDNP